MGMPKIPFWGTLPLTLLLSVLLTSCIPFGERRFSNHLVVKEEYGLPLEVLEAKVLPLRGGGKEIDLHLRNISDKTLLLECEVYLLTGKGIKVSIPGFEVFTCNLSPKREKWKKLSLPLVVGENQTLVVEIRKLLNSPGG